MEKIGKYRILGKIGEGGMGVVYKALDPLLERVVAVKTMSSRLDDDPALRAKFFREGRSAAHLSHRNIITVYDLGEDNGVAYIAMEYLDGEDLRTKIRRKSIQSMDEKLGIMHEVCAGLAHAHARRVIHRDIKPANVFVTASGQIKILDFGLARVMSTETTNTTVAHGSPNYMSPEQVRGDNLDHRTDIFSAGALFYELLNYKKAFEGESVTTVIFNILNQEPDPPHFVDPALPPQLSGIVMRALAKDGNVRYQSMLEVIHDLREYSPFARSLPAPQPEGVDAGPAALTGFGGLDSTFVSCGTLAEPSKTGPPVAGTLVNDTVHAAPPSYRRGRRKAVYIAAACVLLALAAAGLWRAGRGPGTPGDVASAASASHASNAATSTALTGPPGKVKSPPAGIAPGDASRATSQASSSDDSQKAGAAAQAMIKPPARSAAPVEGPASPRANDETPRIVDQGIQDTKSLMAQGKYLDASASLRNVLRIAPTNPSARQLATQLASAEKKAADDYLKAMTESRKRADAAGAGQYAAKLFDAAQNNEASARAAYESQRFNEAAAGFAETSGFYLNAALAAESEKAARENQAKASEQQQQRALQRRQADLSRDAYEQDRLDAVKAGADTMASQQYQEAVRIASDAGSKWDREDYLGSKTDFDRAAEAMRQAKAAALTAARKPEPPAADANPKPLVSAAQVSSPPLNNQEAITAVLQQYAAALESKDMQMLRTIWPGIGAEQERALQEEFRNAREIRVQLAGIDIRIVGDSATATARRTYILLTVEGQKLQTQTRIVVDLRRGGKAWLIDKIRFMPM